VITNVGIARQQTIARRIEIFKHQPNHRPPLFRQDRIERASVRIQELSGVLFFRLRTPRGHPMTVDRQIPRNCADESQQLVRFPDLALMDLLDRQPQRLR